MTKHTPRATGTTIGILGGGQLGRMLALAAAQLGMKTHIFCPDPNSPAFDVTPHKTVAAYDDLKALDAFASSVDVITYEFENVPVATARHLEQQTPVYPNAHVLEISQDRLDEKRFLTNTGIPVAPYHPVMSPDELTRALSHVGLPAVLKTTRLGYDGKGQAMVGTRAEALGAHAALTGQPQVLEAKIPFEREISVIVARSTTGEVRAYEPAENVHRNHILKTSTVPAAIDTKTANQARRIAQQIAEALEYVGVLGVEFFVVPGAPHPTLLVNEIAPRVHNSGHWTQAVCHTNQFEQHIRAICGWPLGDPARFADAVMENLIGDEISSLPASLKADMQPHIYGKTDVRAGRKMGHIVHVGRKSLEN